MRNNRPRIETQLRAAFGLKKIPFTKDADPDGIFRTGVFEQASDRLRYLVDRRGIGVIFGAPGTGKSTLLRSFLETLGKTAHAVAYVSYSTCGVVDIYREIARSFDVTPTFKKADLLRQIQDRVLQLSRTKKIRPVLVLDDAHLLPTGFFDEIRLLCSFDVDGTDDLTVILAGHAQLENTLRLAVNEAIAQRVVIKIRLRSLLPAEVEEYLDARLQQAGRTAKLFLPEATEAIAKASRGIPRLVDRLAEQSLLIALKAKRKEVDAEIVTEATDEVDP